MELSESIKYSPLTFTEAQNQLQFILDNEKLEILPLIFLDEFNVLKSSKRKERAQYSFYRNVFRMAKLIPVLMGTNAHIANMITTGKDSGLKNMVWAFIFHKLPSYPMSVLTESVKKYFDQQDAFFPVLIKLLQRGKTTFCKLGIEIFGRAT